MKSLSLISLTLLSMALAAPSAAAQCQLEELIPSHADSDRYGTAVDLDSSGNLAIVGAPRHDDGAVGQAGAAYIYRFDGTDWVEEQLLLDPMPASRYRFGAAVSIDGDVAVIGLPEDDDFGTRSGSVQVFRFAGGVWTQEQEIFASDVVVQGASSSTRFGWDVDLDGDVFVVGAKENDENTQTNTGAAYVYRFNAMSGLWEEEQKLIASDNLTNAQFGDAVAMDGNNIIVGAWQDNDGADFFVGAAYVYTYDGTVWNEEQKLRASDKSSFDFFGRSVDIKGDLAVVGADKATVNATDSGAAYVFSRSGTVWTEDIQLAATDGEQLDDYGDASAIFEGGNGIVIGAPRDNIGVTSAGSIYQYRKVMGAWTFVDRLVSDDLATGDEFGEFLAASGDRIIAGAKDNDGAGAAYIMSGGAECVGPFANFCNGDGGNQLGCTNCPCGNNAAPGTIGGCINSSGGSTRIDATGDASASLPPAISTDLRFTLSGAQPGAFCVMLSGDAVAPQNMGNMCFGMNSGIQSPDRDGLRCAVQGIKRHGGRSANANGDVMDSAGPSRVWGGEAQPGGGLAVQGGFAAGQTRYFQVTHRENSMLVCARGLNTSQAVEVTFEP